LVQVEVRKMFVNDLEEVAFVHGEAFPGYFLTSMGHRFLKLFYREFIDQTGCHSLVAEHNQKIIGFVVGTNDKSKLLNRFYRRNLISIASIVMYKCLTDFSVLRNILSRVRTAFYSLRGCVVKKESNYNSKGSFNTVRLLSIGVISAYRGKKIAEKLVKEFCDRSGRNGAKYIGLSTSPDNKRAIAFYEKMGWQQIEINEKSISFMLTL